MKISLSFIWAGLIAFIVLFWMLSDNLIDIFVSDQKSMDENIEINQENIEVNNTSLVVSALKVKNESVPVYLRSTGVTRSIFDIQVTTRREGFIKDIFVKDGSFINKGDVIIKLENGTLDKELKAANALLLAEKNKLKLIEKKFEEGGSYSKNLESAQASILKAKKIFESSKKLEAKGIKTELDVVEKFANFKVAEAVLSDLLDVSKEVEVTETQSNLEKIIFDIEKIKEQIAFTNIISPRTGWIENIEVDVGEHVHYNMVVARLIGLRELVLDMQIPQSNIGDIKLGDPVEVTFDKKQYYKGEVQKIGAIANDSTRTFDVEVYIKNLDASLRAGMSGEAKITIDKVMAFRMSPAHLNADNSGTLYAKTIGPNEAVENRAIKIIKTQNNLAYISGLSDNSIVLKTGQAFLKEGDKPKFKISGGEE